MNPINQKGGVPKFAGQAGRLMRRSYFLMQPDPDPSNPQPMMTFYGPGQHVLSFSGNPPYFGGSPGDPWTYASPTDWPPAGAILRAPQVAKLNPATFYTPDGFDDASAFVPANGAQPDEAAAEFSRLSDVCNTVQDNIMSIRQGKTWVDVDFFGEQSYVPGAILNATTNQTNPQNYFDQIAAPDFSTFDSPPSFYGVNFLNVWLGGGTPLTGGFTNYLPGYVGSVADLPAYKNSVANLTYAYPFFNNHTTSLFYFDVIPGPSQDFASSLYDFFASDLSEFKFSSLGGTSQVDADFLTALIAARFNFDPTTGLDL